MKTLFDHDLTLEEAKELIRNGEDVNGQELDGTTPIFYVTNIAIAELLIKSGADINHKDINGCTLFHYINPNKNAFIYVEHGADINKRNNDGNTPLDDYYNTTMINELINNGGLFSKITNYKKYKNFFSKKQQEAFDSFLLLTDNNETFFQMCLAYQNDQKNNIKMDVKDMGII